MEIIFILAASLLAGGIVSKFLKNENLAATFTVPALALVVVGIALDSITL